MTLASPVLPIMLLFFCAVLFQVSTARRFTNIANDPDASGIHYRRAPSLVYKRLQNIHKNSLDKPIPRSSLPNLPWGVHGQPGVAIGDFNDDGVDDIFVTNGPGRANSLFINQYKKTGKVKFLDVAKEMKIESKNHDSNGVCYGDLNGDGLTDFVIVSEYNRNQIFLASKKGYRKVNWITATGDTKIYPSSTCSIGDANGDGKLDIVISNAIRRDSSVQCLIVPFDLSAPNQLFINKGKGDALVSFEDVSLTSGINDYGGDIPPGKFTASWSVAFVDVNMDGNLDIVQGDDQCGYPSNQRDPETGVTRGSIRVLYGDGTGKFLPKTLEVIDGVENNRFMGPESWMSLSFGDFNCDGYIDIFGSNFGDYHSAWAEILGGGQPDGKLGHMSSRWWFGSSTGDFRDASIKETGATSFGWGNGVFDYDNDGDQDIIYVGSIQFLAFAGSDNPNIILKNSKCSGKFTKDISSMEPTGSLRSYQGLALGDFNLDGYPDVVSAASYITRPEQRTRVIDFSSVLDKTAYFTEILKPTNNGTGFIWTGNELDEGDMMVQINSETDTSNCWVSIQPLGMRGLIDKGKENRGALGSILIVKPEGLGTVITPIVGGESLGSQSSPRRNFGLGPKCTGTVDVAWPNGIRNRLYGLKNKEMLTFPEIPCSFTAKWKSEKEYRRCISHSILSIRRTERFSLFFLARLWSSSLRAYREGSK